MKEGLVLVLGIVALLVISGVTWKYYKKYQANKTDLQLKDEQDKRLR